MLRVLSIPLSMAAKAVLWVCGWKILGKTPDEPRYVMLAAPHTSNWDGIVMITLACYYRIRAYWMVKHSLFVGPFGWFLRLIGGVPINRSAAHGVIDAMVTQFNERDRFALLIPPEGTRSRTRCWKSGFYHIATRADVPVVSGLMDWRKKEAGIVDVYHLTGDVKKDMDHFRSIYGDATGTREADDAKRRPPHSLANWSLLSWIFAIASAISSMSFLPPRNAY